MAVPHVHLHEPGSHPASPALLLLHGTGGTEHDLVPLARRLSPGSALLAVRGNVLEGGAPRFFRRFSEGVFDLDDARRRAGELAYFLAETRARHRLGPLHALGFSNGANMAALLLQLHPDALAGGFLLRPMVVLDQAAAPGTLAGRRVFLFNGRADPLVPSDHPPCLARLLEAGGAEVTSSTTGGGHGLGAGDVTALQHALSTSAS